MTDDRAARHTQIVREMFGNIFVTPEDRELDAEGIPNGLRKMSTRYFAPDITFHVPGAGPQAFSGGKEEYYRITAERMQNTEGKLRLKLKDVLSSDRRAAALIHYREERDGEKFDWLRVNMYSFNDEGLINEIRVFEADQHGVDAFYGAG